MSDALTYLDEQIEAIKAHLPDAVESFDVKAIHQARVATRRLKAGLDLLAPLISPSSVKPIARAGRKIRQRLGPLRDLDVMIDHLATIKFASSLGDAVAWVSERLNYERRDARVKDYEHGKKPGKLLDPLDDWWKIRHRLETDAEAIDPVLRHALHDKFADFREEADWVSGVVAPPEDHGPIDVHELRIAGKALRYTFESAAAHGLDVPKSVMKKFKAMQESLGEWHDFVVLVETTLSELTHHELPLHAPDLASDVLDVTKLFIKSANKALGRFKTQWKADGAELADALETAAPLTTDVTEIEHPPLPVEVADEDEFNPPETDPDPQPTPEGQAPSIAGGASEAEPTT